MNQDIKEAREQIGLYDKQLKWAREKQLYCMGKCIDLGKSCNIFNQSLCNKDCAKTYNDKIENIYKQINRNRNKLGLTPVGDSNYPTKNIHKYP